MMLFKGTLNKESPAFQKFDIYTLIKQWNLSRHIIKVTALL